MRPIQSAPDPSDEKQSREGGGGCGFGIRGGRGRGGASHSLWSGCGWLRFVSLKQQWRINWATISRFLWLEQQEQLQWQQQPPEAEHNSCCAHYFIGQCYFCQQPAATVQSKPHINIFFQPRRLAGSNLRFYPRITSIFLQLYLTDWLIDGTSIADNDLDSSSGCCCRHRRIK